MDLTDLQKQLEHIYEIRVDHDVADFLITDSEIASNLEGGTGRRVAPEKLLLFEHQGQMNLSLYLAPEVVEHLAGEPAAIWGASGAAFCLAVEGVSHFLYVAWRAGYDRSLTQMELELQAEVDKFIGLLSLPGMSIGSGFSGASSPLAVQQSQVCGGSQPPRAGPLLESKLLCCYLLPAAGAPLFQEPRWRWPDPGTATFLPAGSER